MYGAAVPSAAIAEGSAFSTGTSRARIPTLIAELTARSSPRRPGRRVLNHL